MRSKRIYRFVKPSAVLGGKYSKEKKGCLAAMRALMRSMNLEEPTTLCEELSEFAGLGDVDRSGATPFDAESGAEPGTDKVALAMWWVGRSRRLWEKKKVARR